MSGGAIKTVSTRDTIPASPAKAAFRGLKPMRFSPWDALLAAQDSLVGASRRLVSFVTGFAGELDDWIPETQTPASMTPNAGFDAAPDRVRITPGNWLEIQVIAQPSGNTRDVSNNTLGARGALIVTIDWSNGAASDQTVHRLELAGSTEPDGGFDGNEWSVITRDKLYAVQPADGGSDPGVQEDFSEWTTCDILYEFEGGARPIDVAVYERGWAHAQDVPSGSDEHSVHCYTVGGGAPLQPPTPGPQEAQADGASSEWRFGTHQLLDVKGRQEERLGPRVICWSSWAPSRYAANGANLPPLNLTGFVAWRDVFNTAITGWDEQNPGWLVEGCNAQVWRYADGNLLLGATRRVIPVRARVYATMAAGASGTAWLRLQSSETEWIEWHVTSVDSPGWLEAVGCLECQAAGDQAGRANAELFFRLTNGADTLELYALSVDFGEW